MAYCSQSDIERKRIPTDTLIQLTDDNGVGEIDAEIVAGACNDATVLVDSYLRGRYPLPLNPIPPIVVTIAADLAAFDLYGLRPQFEIPKTIADRRGTALQLLARIQDGKMPLYDESTQAAVTSTSAPSITGPERLFTRKSMRGF